MGATNASASGQSAPNSQSTSQVKYDPSPDYDPDYWSSQPIGVSRSHLQYFKRFKQNRTDRYATETNKLILRLDRLTLSSGESGEARSSSPAKSLFPGRKREYEKAVVPWVDDSVVKLFFDEVSVNLDVLCPVMLYRILRDANRSLVVAKQLHR